MKASNVCVLLIAFCFTTSHAAQQNAITTVVNIYAYTQFGGGDVQVMVANPPAGCSDGFWLKASDEGFKTSFSVLLSAYHTGSRIRIGGIDTELWSGSSGVYCRISYVALMPN
jgi:hypothetical protein